MVTMVMPHREPSIMLPSAGPTVLLVGDPYTLLLSGEQTNGAFALYEAGCSPGFGPPLHYHTREDETFYVLEGLVKFQIGQREHVLGPGATVHAPRNVVHCFHNDTAQPARLLIQVTPAGSFDRYVEEVGEPFDLATYQPGVAPTAEHLHKVLARGPKYGIFFEGAGD